MRRFRRTAVCAMVFFLTHDALGQLPPGLRTSRDEHDPTDLPATVTLIVDGTNTFRKENKLKPLSPDARLTKASEAFAAFLAEHGELSHEADGRHPADRAAAAGYDYAALAENIAEEMRSSGFTPQELADHFLDGWKKSPGHRRNMLDTLVTQIGVGVAYNRATDTYYAVQMFGKPRSAEVTFHITNKTGSTVKYKVAGKDYSLPPKGVADHSQPAARDVVFQWPPDKPAPGGRKTLRPRDGDQIVIQVNAKGTSELKVQPAPRPKPKPAGKPPAQKPR